MLGISPEVVRDGSTNRNDESTPPENKHEITGIPKNWGRMVHVELAIALRFHVKLHGGVKFLTKQTWNCNHKWM